MFCKFFSTVYHVPLQNFKLFHHPKKQGFSGLLYGFSQSQNQIVYDSFIVFLHHIIQKTGLQN